MKPAQKSIHNEKCLFMGSMTQPNFSNYVFRQIMHLLFNDRFLSFFTFAFSPKKVWILYLSQLLCLLSINIFVAQNTGVSYVGYLRGETNIC